MDQNSLDYVSVTIFVKGIDDENLSSEDDGPLKDHPFLDLLELDKIPMNKGEARLLSNFFDYSLLFDDSKQPYKFNINKKRNINDNSDDDPQIQFIEKFSFNKDYLSNAINDLVYNKHFPLKEFYMYNGSFSKPPCDENVTYVIKPIPIYAPLEQIIVIYNN
jgi:hypothetical protein